MFKGLSLASPTAHTADELSDADPVAHSIGVYKGKVFLLVSLNKFAVVITHFNYHRNEHDWLWALY